MLMPDTLRCPGTMAPNCRSPLANRRDRDLASRLFCRVARGCAVVAEVAMSLGGVYPASETGSTRSPRGQERLADLRQALVALGAALGTDASEGNLETIFERQVRQLLNL